jgi:hypothetical protein
MVKNFPRAEGSSANAYWVKDSEEKVERRKNLKKKEAREK